VIHNLPRKPELIYFLSIFLFVLGKREIMEEGNSTKGRLKEEKDKVENNCAPISLTLTAKWGKQRIVLENLDPSTTILELKDMLTAQTNILPKRQKLIGLALKTGSVEDSSLLSDLNFKKKRHLQEFILMGTPEKEIFVDPSDKTGLPVVVDDFNFDFNAGSKEWIQHVATGENLRNFTEKTSVNIMNEPRDGKPLLVLDLDHTLLDFSSKQLQHSNFSNSVSNMKRPHMDEFLTNVYRHYDLVVWSQTSWRWLETKLVALGMLAHPGYKFCFVLDKTSMFEVISSKKDGNSYRHHVKPLQIIWSKFPRWNVHNTVHIDDVSRNFALNLKSGLKVSAYSRKRSSARKDVELLCLARYLGILVIDCKDFQEIDFSSWHDVVSGKYSLKKS